MPGLSFIIRFSLNYIKGSFPAIFIVLDENYDVQHFNIDFRANQGKESVSILLSHKAFPLVVFSPFKLLGKLKIFYKT